jgi:hypothetical protein
MALEREKLNESIRQFEVKNGSSGGGSGGGGNYYQLPTNPEQEAPVEKTNDLSDIGYGSKMTDSQVAKLIESGRVLIAGTDASGEPNKFKLSPQAKKEYELLKKTSGWK